MKSSLLRSRLSGVISGSLACVGLGLGLYLAVVSGRPVGCGAGSGCERVLSSRWAGIGPVPVGALGAAAYVGVLVCLIAGWRAVLAGAALGVCLVGAAAWFVVLQLGMIHAVCPYCMAEHAIGALVGVILVVRASEAGAKKLIGPIVAGLLAVAALVGLQVGFPHESRLQRLPAHGNFDTGVGPERTIGVLDGSVRLRVWEEPVLGSPDAKHVLVGMFDYACPHCRRTHEYLVEAIKRWPNDLAIIVLPCPLNASCNPHVPETEPRFAESCELAKIALVVHRLKPEAFAAFDSWLLEPETPRTAAEARAKAVEVVGAGALVAALASPELAQKLARNTAAFGRSGVDRLPILLSPEIGGIAGRPESQEQLFELLQKELHLPGGGG